MEKIVEQCGFGFNAAFRPDLLDYGGNYDKVGWKLIGFQDDFYFKPPFGYYDREYKETQ